MISSKTSLGLLRIAMGAFFLYAGVSKIVNPDWSAAGYLSNAGTFNGLYSWLASSSNIGWINFTNEWGLTLIGLALVFGVLVKPAAYAGALMMILYYFPVLDFPYAGEHALLVDDHIIYALVLLVLASHNTGSFWSLSRFFRKKSR